MRQLFHKSMIAVAAVGALAVSYSAPAHAWWRGGVVFAPIPFFAPPPVVYPPYYYPPAYYPPPPPPAAYTADPGYAPNGVPGEVAGGRACYAGGYVCPLNQPVPPGGACSCPTNSGGRIGGRAG